MVVKRIEFNNYILSIGTNYYPAKPKVRKEFLDNPKLNIYHPKKGNPVVENLMDKVVLNRSIPLNDGIETLRAIRENFPFMKEYLDECIRQLENYEKMI